MKAKLIFAIFIFLISSCNFKTNTSFVDESGYTVVGPKFTGKKTGKYIYYYPNGNLRGIYNYKEDCITGEMYFIDKDSTYNRSFFKDCKPQFIYTINKQGDTLLYFKKNRMISYFKKSKLINELIYFENTRENDRKIIFDSLGRLKELRYTALFLNAEDSTLLSKSYPNWKEQVKEWESKHP